MWIKHNNALYNTEHMRTIKIFSRTKLKAIFMDGSEVIIGEFKTVQEANDIFSSITRQLLFEDPLNPGKIIRDTKGDSKK